MVVEMRFCQIPNTFRAINVYVLKPYDPLKKLVVSSPWGLTSIKKSTLLPTG